MLPGDQCHSVEIEVRNNRPNWFVLPLTAGYSKVRIGHRLSFALAGGQQAARSANDAARISRSKYPLGVVSVSRKLSCLTTARSRK
jgi:hypothetical protein